jgi:replicative DNA helicase
MNEAFQHLASVVDVADHATKWQTGKEAAIEALKWLHRKQAAPDGIIGLPTGFHEIDVATGGMEPGRVWIVGARPGVGKTAQAGQIARHNAELGNKVAFFTFEQPPAQLILRMAVGKIGASIRRVIATPGLNRQIMEAMRDIGQLPIEYCEGPPRWTAIKDAIAMQADQGAKLVVADYLQLIDRSDAMRSRVDALGQITAELKTVAKESGVAVVALAQLNRSGNDAPSLVHLKDAGSIEQDADVVILLHRDQVKDTDGKPTGDLEDTGAMMLAKNRDGGTGSYDAHFDGSTYTWKI